VVACADCQRSPIGNCGQHTAGNYTVSNTDGHRPTIVTYTTIPLCAPPVCTGTGWVAIEYQGLEAGSELPAEGTCGICKQTVYLDRFCRCVVHPFVPSESK
jgi:hypothetical protein